MIENRPIIGISIGDPGGVLDDPQNKEYAYVSGFRDLSVRFIAVIKRISDPDLFDLVVTLKPILKSIIDWGEKYKPRK
jgi:hypothetical protein